MSAGFTKVLLFHFHSYMSIIHYSVLYIKSQYHYLVLSESEVNSQNMLNLFHSDTIHSIVHPTPEREKKEEYQQRIWKLAIRTE